MVRALSLYLPWWPIERLTRREGALEPDRPILLVETIASRQSVVHACPRAVEAGVRPGMTVAHARALLPDATRSKPQILDHDPRRDHEALRQLARWATRIVPIVSPDPPDGLLLDISGCARLYHGERNLFETLVGEVKRLGLTPSAAVAPTFGCAWALARYGTRRNSIVDQREEIARALWELPVCALRIGEETSEALSEIGVRRIGQLLDLPRSQIPARFSENLTLRLDQVLGRAIEFIDPVRSSRSIQVDWHFAGPVIGLEVVQSVARQLLEVFENELLHDESGVRRVRFTLDRYEAEPVQITLSLSRPTRDRRHLWKLLEPKLERANLGDGVEAIEIRALEIARLAHRQFRHCHIADESTRRDVLDEEQGRLLDTLIHRMGRERVMRVRFVESHVPERVQKFVPFDQPGSSGVDLPQNRPTKLFELPEPVDVQALTPDGPVMQVNWKGRCHRVEHCRGPERLTSEWWHEPSGGRDYFVVQVEGGEHLWVYRDVRRGAWFVHGRWA